jgi:hypothetical protein
MACVRQARLRPKRADEFPKGKEPQGFLEEILAGGTPPAVFVVVENQGLSGYGTSKNTELCRYAPEELAAGCQEPRGGDRSSAERDSVAQEDQTKPIRSRGARSRANSTKGRDALGLLNCSITERESIDGRASLMRCSGGPLERKTFTGRTLSGAARRHWLARFSAERPRTCGVNWSLLFRKSLRALTWRIFGTWNGTFRRFQAWF